MEFARVALVMPTWKSTGQAAAVLAALYLLRQRLAGRRPHELAYPEGVFDALRGRRGRWRKQPR